MQQYEKRLYAPATHPHFDYLAAMFVSLASIDSSLTAYANNGIVLAPTNPDNALHIGGLAARHSFHTHDLMHGAARDRWPSVLVVYCSKPAMRVDFHEGARDLFNEGLQRAIEQILGATFLKFYESRSQAWKSAMGSQPKNWPELWRFAWVIRNAIAHGDRISIDDPSFVSCSWRCFTVTAQHNGQRWFDMDAGFLGGGDLLELIDELHHGGPVPNAI